jgi:pyruvate carboxylase
MAPSATTRSRSSSASAWRSNHGDVSQAPDRQSREIGISISRAAAELEIPKVAVFSSDDAAALHVRKADEAIALDGGGAAAYLDVENILDVTAQTGCDALPPRLRVPQ